MTAGDVVGVISLASRRSDNPGLRGISGDYFEAYLSGLSLHGNLESSIKIMST